MHPLPKEKVHVIGHPLVVVGQGAEKSCQVLTVTQEGREDLHRVYCVEWDEGADYA